MSISAINLQNFGTAEIQSRIYLADAEEKDIVMQVFLRTFKMHEIAVAAEHSEAPLHPLWMKQTFAGC